MDEFEMDELMWKVLLGFTDIVPYCFLIVYTFNFLFHTDVTDEKVKLDKISFE